MDLLIKGEWTENSEEKKMFKDTLDESDAFLYQEMIKKLSPEKKKKGKKLLQEQKKPDKPQKISEYYQNFCKKSNFKEVNSSKTVSKNYNGISQSYKNISKFKDFTLSQQLRFSAGSGKSFGQKKQLKLKLDSKKGSIN